MIKSQTATHFTLSAKALVNVGSHPGTDFVDQPQIFTLEYLMQPSHGYSVGTMQVAHRRILPGFNNTNHGLVVLEEHDARFAK